MTDWKNWFYGLVAAVIGSVSNAVVLIIADPQTFNLQEGLSKLLTVMASTAILSAAMYLKQTPLPPKVIILLVTAGLLSGCAIHQIKTSGKTSTTPATCEASSASLFMSNEPLNATACHGTVNTIQKVDADVVHEVIKEILGETE